MTSRRRWPKPTPPRLPLPVDTPNRRYYFGTGIGHWLDVFRYAITNWRLFWHARLSFQKRLLALGMAAVMGIFREACIDSVIEAYPDQGQHGVATNEVRISLSGITLYLLSEQYALGDDGESMYVRSYERFGPLPFLFNVEKQHPAKITVQGMHATYYIPLLDSDWVGEYAV